MVVACVCCVFVCVVCLCGVCRGLVILRRLVGNKKSIFNKRKLYENVSVIV